MMRRNKALGSVLGVGAVLVLVMGPAVMAGVAWAAPGGPAGNGDPSPNGAATGNPHTTTTTTAAPPSSPPAAGDTSQPQPPSNADFSGNGANVHGAYDSTRDGSPSLNGNGGGGAFGKPCAGCVGKADNKNPKGQRPDGSDHNAGYECDTNAGIGRSNPAHTGCTPSVPPPVVNPPDLCANGGCASPPCAAITGHPCEVAAQVLGEVITRDPATSTTKVLGLELSRSLAATGGAIGGEAILSLAMLLTGALVLAAGRRRGPTPVRVAHRV